MAFTNRIAMLFPPDRPPAEGGLQAATTLNATTTKMGFIFQARDTANASAVFIKVNTVTTAQSLKVSLQSVSSASLPGVPSGTILGATSNGYGTIASPTAGLYEVTLGETVPLVAGTFYALVIEWTGTTGNLAVINRYTFAICGTGAAYSRSHNYSSGAWSYAFQAGPQAGLAFGVKTDAANWWHPELIMPASSTATNQGSFLSSSSPDEIGNKIYLPAGNVTGIFVASDQDGAADLVLYDALNNVVASYSMNPNNRQGATYAFYLARFAPVAIAEGTFRVVLKPTGTTDYCTRFTVNYTSSQLNGRAMGANCCLTQRTDGGSWTDTQDSMMYIGVEMEPTFGSGGGVAAGFSMSRLINLGG